MALTALPEQRRILDNFDTSVVGKSLIERDRFAEIMYRCDTYWTRQHVDAVLKAAGYAAEDRSIDYRFLLEWIFSESIGDPYSSTSDESCAQKEIDKAVEAAQITDSRPELTMVDSFMQSASTEINTSPSPDGTELGDKTTRSDDVVTVHVVHDELRGERTSEISSWQPGDLVDRLVDDIGDIWVGAVVCAAYADDLFDIMYADTGASEQGVEGTELRRRQPPFQVTPEFWARTCQFISDGKTLSAVEQVERAARSAVAFEAAELWSLCYHCVLGKCGARCTLPASMDGFDPVQVSQVSIECVRVAADPVQSPLSKHRRPWKERYAERYLDLQLERLQKTTCLQSTPSPNGFAMGVDLQGSLDGRIRFGRDALRGSAFDPMLGRMVAEDGGDGKRVVISRGKTWYSH